MSVTDPNLGAPGANNAPPPQNGGASGSSPGASPTQQYDPAYVAQLEQYARQAKPILDAIEPHYDLVRKVVSDEEFREVANTGYSAYEQAKKARAPQMDPAFAPIADDVRQVKDYINEQKQAAAAAQQAQGKARFDTDLAYANRLCAEHPEFAANDYRKIRMLNAVAKEEGVTLEEAFKREGSSFVSTVKEPPPRSLRGATDVAGVPAASAPQPIKNKTDLVNRIKANLEAASTRAS